MRTRWPLISERKADDQEPFPVLRASDDSGHGLSIRIWLRLKTASRKIKLLVVVWIQSDKIQDWRASTIWLVFSQNTCFPNSETIQCRRLNDSAKNP